MSRYVFASVPFANAAPLAHFLEPLHEEVRTVYARPSDLAAEVIGGAVDAALVPVADYFAVGRMAMIHGLGICADGPVESVLLKCSRPIEQVRTVCPDPASKSSNALCRILLEDHLHLHPRFTGPAAGEPADAEVCIGDRALLAPPAPCGDYDLAELWKRMTGLPFVFAVWAHRADHPDPVGLRRIAYAAKEAGMAAIDELAAAEADRLALPVERCRTYLTLVIHYDVGPRESAAMGLFGEMLASRASDAATDGASLLVEAGGDNGE